jgi:hypothetical protein
VVVGAAALVELLGSGDLSRQFARTLRRTTYWIAFMDT